MESRATQGIRRPHFWILMNQEIAWLHGKVEELQSTARSVQWHFDQLQSHRAEIGPAWDDRCATEISKRYLDPMATDARACIEGMESQVGQMNACIDRLQDAENDFAMASEAALSIEHLLSDADTAFRVLESLLSEMNAAIADATARIGEASDCLDQAQAEGASA